MSVEATDLTQVGDLCKRFQMGVVKSILEKSFTCCIVVSSQWGGARTAREARACSVFTRVIRVIFHQL